MNAEQKDIIRQSSLFRGISPASLEFVYQTVVTRWVEEDSFIFQQGDEAKYAYVLLRGRVKMLQLTPQGQQIVLRLITPGQTFGGVALLNPDAGYPASAQAAEHCQAAAWSSVALRQLARSEPSIPLNAMQLMYGYITELQARQQALVTGRVKERIARILLKLAAQSGKRIETGVLIDMPLTRQDIAEMSGTTLFTVSRTLNEWERRGLLVIGREKVIICLPHELVRIAEGLIS